MIDFLGFLSGTGGAATFPDLSSVLSSLNISGPPGGRPTGYPLGAGAQANIQLWENTANTIVNGIIAKNGTVTGTDVDGAISALQKIQTDVVTYLQTKGLIASPANKDWVSYVTQITASLIAAFQALKVTLSKSSTSPAAPSSPLVTPSPIVQLPVSTNWALWLGALLTAILLIYLLTRERKK